MVFVRCLNASLVERGTARVRLNKQHVIGLDNDSGTVAISHAVAFGWIFQHFRRQDLGNVSHTVEEEKVSPAGWVE